MQQKNCRASAFTLLEMLGVLSILAILVSLVLPIVQKTRAQARTSRAKSDISKIESALHLYKIDYGTGPNGAVAGLILVAEGLYTIVSADPAAPLLSPSTKEPYLKVPAASTLPSTRQFVDPWKTPYWIRPTAINNPNDFDVFSAGPDKTRGTVDDVNNWGR